MRVHRNASIDRLMTRRSEKMVRSEMFKNYLNNVSKTKKSEYSRVVSASGVRIELSYEAKCLLRNNYIDEVLESGEPLHGVSYDDYVSYYKDKHGFIDYKVEQDYKQALKGDNASLREMEWRNNPNYEIPQRLFDNPLVAADRDAVLEKIRNDKELDEWEHKLLNTFPDAVEGCNIVNEALVTQRFRRLEKNIAADLTASGIEFDSDEELKFEVWGYEMKVSGYYDDEKMQTVLDSLGHHARSMYYLYLDHHNQMSKNEINECIGLLQAENYLKDTGVSVFDISLDDKGNLRGLPDELADFINENADKPLVIDTSKGWDERDPDVQQARLMRDELVSAVKTIQKGKYNYYRSKIGVFTYKNGILSC